MLKYRAAFLIASAGLALTCSSFANDKHSTHVSNGIKSVFSEARVEAPRVGWINPRDQVIVLETQGEFALILRPHDQLRGYTSIHFFDPPLANAAPSATDIAPIEQPPTPDRIAAISPAAKPSKAKTNTPVKASPTTRTAELDSAQPLMRSTIHINFRADPDLNSAIVGVLSTDDVVQLVEKNGSFAKIKRLEDNKVGFLKAHYLVAADS